MLRPSHTWDRILADTLQAEDKPGFVDALLNILEAEQDNGVKLSTAVYLKNRVSKGWSALEEFSQARPVPEEEKASFRLRVVPILVASPPPIRMQLIPTLQKILSTDFPQQWPAFLEMTIQLLNGQDAQHVSAGVQLLLAICKIYRFKSGNNREDFDKIVENTFPQLLNIGNSLVNETSLEAGEILRTVLKVYKNTIIVSLASPLVAGCRDGDKSVG